LYDPSLISRKIDSLAEVAGLRQVREHSIAEIEELTARLADARGPKGEVLRALSAEEEDFILSEKVLSVASWEYWAQRYCWCSHEGAGIKRMYPLFDSQALILQEFARIEREIDANQLAEGILVNVLKARRLGASTFSQSVLTHRFVTQTYIYGLTAADVPGQSSYNFGMFKLTYQHLPWWMRPALLSFSNTYPEEYEFETGSQYWCHAGQSTRGVQGERGQIGRGKGVSICHLTELTTWEDTNQIDSSLLPIFPYSPRTLVIFESSPRGRNNWWHQHWQVSMEKTGRFVPIFIPWYAEPQKYRKVAPPGWTPNEATLVHARRCEAQGPRWLHRPKVSLTREQLYWYETTRAYYEAKHALSDFLQEYAADPEECFIHSAKTLILPEVLQRHIDQARPLVGAFEIAAKRDIEKAQRLEALEAEDRRT
jgi:hypothetical protein